ncbi:MAG TPA: cation transporter, partial [Nitrosospira sp.]
MAIQSTHLKIKGMHCMGCEETIENAVGRLPGVRKVKADYVKRTVDVEFDGKLLGDSGICQAIEKKGYEFEGTFKNSSPHIQNGLFFLLFLLVVGGITFLGKSMVPGLIGEMNPNLGHAMLSSIGFFTGFHCIGMCGGFVVGYATTGKPQP